MQKAIRHTYPIDCGKTLSRKQADQVSTIWFSLCGGVKANVSLAEGYRDTDYRYTVSAESKRALSRESIGVLRGIVLAIAYGTSA